MRTLRSSNAFTLLATAATVQVELSASQQTRGADRQLVMTEGAVVIDT
ncbi:hypothetical protein I2H36_17380 [Microvirga sp. BT290]|uniref:Amidohydrolase n=1 Tax=Microvirga terrestris TaxID=2791024 RepID=A0ABS0HWG0_9HYPH|nr:hypothetical protein [Microvirga terrestris]